MSFIQRTITVSFQLNNGKTFGGSQSSSVTLSGLRVSATINKMGSPGMGQTQLRIFGLPPSLMQQLSTYGLPVNLSAPTIVTVQAGDAQSGMATVSRGTLRSAWTDYDQAPEVCFNVEVSEGYDEGLKVIPPTSIKGTADCAQIMQQIAGQMGLAFENSGVSAKLSNPYFSGDARTQAQECADAGNFSWFIEGGTLAIWPRGGARKGNAVTISPSTGMVGYPKFMAYGVIVKALLNPAIRYGTVITVQSSLKPACGSWGVVQMVSELESETPDGAWFTTMQALRLDYVPTVNQTAINIPPNL